MRIMFFCELNVFLAIVLLFMMLLSASKRFYQTILRSFIIAKTFTSMRLLNKQCVYKFNAGKLTLS